MGLSINEVLIFASLVQREAQIGQEFPVIAGLYLNRFEIFLTLRDGERHHLVQKHRITRVMEEG